MPGIRFDEGPRRRWVAVIVALCSGKGSPGVTTLATALALAWPGERILMEADPSGGDLSLRLNVPGAEFLDLEPSVLTLAMAIRSGTDGTRLCDHAQNTSLGIRVVPGPPTAEAWTPMRHLWPQVAARMRDCPGTVIADLGRLQPGHPGLAVLEAADAVLLLTRPSVDGLFHARERVVALEDTIAPRIRVIVRSGRRPEGSVSEAAAVLRTLVPVMGGFADDPAAVALLLRGQDSAQLRRAALLRSAAGLAARLQSVLPAHSSAAPSSADHRSRRFWRHPR